ncbi:MAG: DUF268 domain-containing protein [Lentisphaerae bacterium]|nr:DUF268 domain-containing protein [Lentisphaerota bacterium]
MAPEDIVPCMADQTATTAFEPHYLYHPAWAARVLRQLTPAVHVDISSSLHFCTLVSAFIPVRFYDFRPARLHLPGLTCASADLTRLAFPDNSIASLSCMHVIEHIGLGRYGDPFDYDGDLRAAAELTRVLAPAGSLLMVVPVGKPKIAFNAHRIYSHDMVLKMFAGLTLVEFSLIPDDALTAGMMVNATAAQADAQSFGCGCFWFRKP